MNEPDSARSERQERDIPVSHVNDAPMCLPLMPADVIAHFSTEELSSFFCTLVDATLDAIVAHRSDGTVVYVNRGACEQFGYEPDEFLGIEPWGWIAPNKIVGAPTRIETILHEGRLAFTSMGRRKDGSVFPTEVASRRADTSIGPIVVAVIRDVSERTEAQRQLEYLAYHDALTGLSNRSLFDDRLALVIADARRYGDLLGLAYIDLDEFKPINDRYGHAVGDDVLVEVGRRLRDEVREQDAVARLGGDEFVIIIPRLVSPSELAVVAQRIIGRIEEPIVVEGHVLRIRAAIGLALFDAASDDARSLLVKADVAMYAAKLDVQSPWLIYDERMSRLQKRLEE